MQLKQQLVIFNEENVTVKVTVQSFIFNEFINLQPVIEDGVI